MCPFFKKNWAVKKQPIYYKFELYSAFGEGYSPFFSFIDEIIAYLIEKIALIFFIILDSVFIPST